MMTHNNLKKKQNHKFGRFKCHTTEFFGTGSFQNKEFLKKCLKTALIKLIHFEKNRLKKELGCITYKLANYLSCQNF